jgi:hypothetical protein
MSGEKNRTQSSTTAYLNTHVLQYTGYILSAVLHGREIDSEIKGKTQFFEGVSEQTAETEVWTFDEGSDMRICVEGGRKQLHKQKFR